MRLALQARALCFSDLVVHSAPAHNSGAIRHRCCPPPAEAGKGGGVLAPHLIPQPPFLSRWGSGEWKWACSRWLPVTSILPFPNPPTRGMKGKSDQNPRARTWINLCPPCRCGVSSQPPHTHSHQQDYMKKHFHSRTHTRYMHLKASRSGI